MNRIKRSATESPLIFGLGSTQSFVLIIIVSAVIGYVWPGEPYRPYIGGTIVRVVSIIILLLLISRLGWLSEPDRQRCRGHSVIVAAAEFAAGSPCPFRPVYPARQASAFTDSGCRLKDESFIKRDMKFLADRWHNHGQQVGD